MRILIFFFCMLAVYPVSALYAGSRIEIPAGTATVGTNLEDLKSQFSNPRVKTEWYADETPQRKVSVNAFMMDATEVTNDEYNSFKPDHSYPKNLANHPVVNVTWEEANSYCHGVGGRLPTEEEWERAARGDDGRLYPWGNEFSGQNLVYADTEGDARKLKVGSFELESSGSALLGGTMPVASMEGGKSPFGLYDMAGNVWEWVDGWYDKEKGLRLLKGGSWLTPSGSVRSAVRLGDDPNSRFNDYGFRCVYDPD